MRFIRELFFLETMYRIIESENRKQCKYVQAYQVEITIKPQKHDVINKVHSLMAAHEWKTLFDFLLHDASAEFLLKDLEFVTALRDKIPMLIQNNWITLTDLEDFNNSILYMMC